jgi:hypothetical protein
VLIVKGEYVILSIICIVIFLSSTASSVVIKNTAKTDLDPLVDISVTFELKKIRYLEDNLGTPDDTTNVRVKNRISHIITFIRDLFNKKSNIYSSSDPGFYVKLYIDNQEFVSPQYNNKYIYEPEWEVTCNVDDEKEFVDIKIQLYNSQSLDQKSDILYDISPDYEVNDDSYDAELTYSIKTGHWSGDDYISDESGYGRLCGTDDGTIKKTDRDCELYFDIYQNDYDGDKIPYWSEINEYNSDPETNLGEDPDNDLVSTVWEHKWGYNPFQAEDHEELDSDTDSINNYEEFLTSEWDSDPYRKDVFTELDIMQEGPNGEKTYFPTGAVELLKTAFNRQNIVYHLDTGEMGGSEEVPFYEIANQKLHHIYYDYFLHGDGDNWRKGVFRYGLVVYATEGPPGFAFRSNAFVISSSAMEEKCKNPFCGTRDICYGSVYMHETGHSFGFWPIPGHDDDSMYPWQPGYWENRPYVSCMNYGWMYQFVDYSDGSNPEPDINDWARIRYDHFEKGWG